MSAFKGTPGPWFVGETLRSGSLAVIGDGDSVVCEFPGRFGASVAHDARLLAEAPALLSALREALRSLEYTQDVHGEQITGGHQRADAIDQARYAIARATGAALSEQQS